MWLLYNFIFNESQEKINLTPILLSLFPSLPTSLTPSLSLSVRPSTHRKGPLSRLTVATRLSPITMAVSVLKCVQGKVWWNLLRDFNC